MWGGEEKSARVSVLRTDFNTMNEHKTRLFSYHFKTMNHIKKQIKLSLGLLFCSVSAVGHVKMRRRLLSHSFGYLKSFHGVSNGDSVARHALQGHCFDTQNVLTSVHSLM